MPKFLTHIPLWLLVLDIGIIFILVGVLQGDFIDTLRRAALICYQCIGIG